MSTGENDGIDSARRTLVRILRPVFPDETRCQWAIDDALRSARRTKLPCDGAELLQFVRAHLAPRLGEWMAPSQVLSLVDALAAVLEHPGVTRPTERSLQRATTPAREPVASVPFPKLQTSFGKLARTASTRLSAVRTPSVATKPPTSGVVGQRASLLLVDSDRLTRASMARALVNAKFDVSAVDGLSHLQGALQGQSCRTLIVMRVGQHDGGTLRALADGHPDLPLVAWTSAPPPVAEKLLSVAGVRRSTVISQTASYAELIDSIRTFLVELERPPDVSRTPQTSPRKP